MRILKNFTYFALKIKTLVLTTGHGDITPVTYTGKLIGIFLMLSGTALFAMYTGLFAEVILTSEKLRKR